MLSNYPIVWIDSDAALHRFLERPELNSTFTFDTEYDSFKRSYGFKALLIQIFDGSTVFIIDPLSGIDLKRIWPLFENTDIQKILYSGSEDLALLKAMGCHTHNIFDVQIAATLSNHAARNLGGLIEAETGSPLDKSQQQSDWSLRPLSQEQLAYAANDVIYLPEIANRLTAQVAARGLLHVLQAENNALEEINPRSHSPKLKPYHHRLYSDAFCASLMQLLELRDDLAREWDLPPVHLSDLPVLEQALLKRDDFLAEHTWKGFHPKIRKSLKEQAKFLDIVRHFDPTDQSRIRERKPKRAFYTKEETDKIIADRCAPFKQAAVERYGEITADYLLRGLKKLVTTPEPDLSDLKAYQIELYTCMKDGNEWPWK
jgi:ribonuclease D